MMRIDHIFHHLNAFGGAEEHIVALAEMQKRQGDDVAVCLIQAVNRQNQYAQRLRAIGVTIHQWPGWLSQLSGDWNTQEAIRRALLFGLAPVVMMMAAIAHWATGQSQAHLRQSIDGRLRMIFKRVLHQNHEKQLFLWLLARRAAWHRPAVLHLHSYGAGLEFVLQWAIGQQLPVVYQEHSTPDLIERPFYTLPADLNLATVVIAVSETSAQALRQFCHVTRPIEVVPPIVAVKQPPSFPAAALQPGCRQLQIVTIARLSEEKGLCYLIEAAAQVLKATPNVQFSIYGEGHLRDTLQRQIDQAHIAQQVHLAGSFMREQLPAMLNHADLFVLPSLTEGFPLAIVEAMVWGRPIVATAVGGIPELVEDGVTALLCPARDATALANAMLKLINAPVLAHSLGAAARRAYDQGNLKPAGVAARFAQIYPKAIALAWQSNSWRVRDGVYWLHTLFLVTFLAIGAAVRLADIMPLTTPPIIVEPYIDDVELRYQDPCEIGWAKGFPSVANQLKDIP